jgi:hypothetical protein
VRSNYRLALTTFVPSCDILVSSQFWKSGNTNRMVTFATIRLIFPVALLIGLAAEAAAVETAQHSGKAATFDISAIVNVFEMQTLSRVISVQGSVAHTQCTATRITAHIERQCFPPLYEPDTSLFSVSTPQPLRNPFSADDNGCFTVIGGRVTNVEQNCFEGEVIVRQCETHQPEECSWSLRNGTRYVAQAVAQREMRLQVGTEFTTWNNVQPGTYEFALPEPTSTPDPEYDFRVIVRNTVTGATVDLSSGDPERSGIVAKFDAPWRKLEIKIR